MVSNQALREAYAAARDDLLAERVQAGHWIGRLSTSALSTATAVSALAIVQRESGEANSRPYDAMIARGLKWLEKTQNRDGGWGDTDLSLSNISTTMLVRAAFHLAEFADEHAEKLKRAETYISEMGGIEGLRLRYGKDRTFAVPILTNGALAGLVDWKEVSPLPFELACPPPRFYRFLRLSVVSYAIPALVAIGQARFFHRRPRNPLIRWLRQWAVKPSLRVLERMQPASGGFLEAVPLTSFVVMSLASTGRVDHPVTKQGVKFLTDSLREDGTWPIDTNLATWNTTLSINALAAGGEDVSSLSCFSWLLDAQHREMHPYTRATPGGWAWTDLSGGVPDVDDTSGALLAIAVWSQSTSDEDHQRQAREAAEAGVGWLLDLQNGDGGWPTFCRGWGTLPFDRSGSDLTAHALRALHVWRRELPQLSERISTSVRRGFDHLAKSQHVDGSWTPLWFGNQFHPVEENPVYGTARVLLAYRDYGSLDEQPAKRGRAFLERCQNADGGWGGEPAESEDRSGSYRSSVEETAVALEALVANGSNHSPQDVITKGITWLIEAVGAGRHREPSPLGFYFAKLWYYEDLYPLIFTVAALGRAACLLDKSSPPQPTNPACPSSTSN
ncbi:MAG: squalene--hopene cyclase [Planctomycetes bacterium]|nr:squalene--hopene cyclase [Planctomycetota bacterium]